MPNEYCLDVPAWKPADVKDIVSIFGMIIISRLGHTLSDKALSLLREASKFEENVAFVEISSSSEFVSSTDIREKLRNGLSIKGLTTTGVIDYISSHHLYGRKAA